MSAGRKLLPGKRNFTLYISVFALISIFFIGFFFYYIPSNRDALNKYAFSILQSISNNIRQKARNNINLYKPYSKIKNGDNIDAINVKMKDLKLDGRIDANYTLVTCGDTVQQKLYRGSFQDTKIKYGINGQQFYYSYNGSSKVYVVIPARSMIRELLENRNMDVFESFLLLKICNGKAYSVYSDINIGQEIIADSLLADQKKGKILLPGIRDIDLKGLTYKMLFIPFNLQNDQLVICGFVKSETYSSQLNLIPVRFIYPIIIAALLLMIALPLIKFYIMGPGEALRTRDLFGFLISVFVGSTLLTIVIIQVILILDGDIRAKSDIEKLSAKIHNSICNELLQAYDQLETIDDTLFSKYHNAVDSLTQKKGVDISKDLLTHLDNMRQIPSSNTYYNFDRISWINDTGYQFLKAQIKDTPVYQNVTERKYVKMLKEDNPYMLPGRPNTTFGLEPLFSWTNGEFTFVMSKKSNLNDSVIVSFSTKLYSVIETILPPGYGFCVVDEEGNVLVHSDLNRSLNENFLDQSVPSLPLREAIASRQNMSFNEIKFYGKTFALNLKPISGLPLYLATFYDKGYIVPVNMRILIFSLIFCFAFYIVLLLLWFFAIRKKHYANPLLYSPMDVLHWVIPKQYVAPYYRRCYRFLICYIAILLLVFFTQAKFTNLNSNYFVLNIILLTPINIVCALAIFVDPPPISSLLIKKIRPATVALWSLIGITLFTAIYIALFTNLNVAGLFTFQFLFVIAMILYPYVLKPLSFEKPGKGKGYIFSYAVLIELLVICFAVLPAGLFTWYSHNQEIIQGVKKQQLYMADKIQKRIHSIQSNLKDLKADWLPQNALNNAQYKNGVYPVYPTTIITEKLYDSTFPKRDYESFEQLYFDVANRIGNNYYDPENYPALQDSSYDNTWFWLGEKAGNLEFNYMLYKNTPRKDLVNAIKMTTELPPRYVFLSATSKGLLLLILVLSFLYGLFAIIYYISNNLFLQKYLALASSYSPQWKGIGALISPYKTIPDMDPPLEKKLLTLPNEYKRYPPNLDEEEIIAGEKTIITTAKELKIFYDGVWKACTDEQKYLLINFSKSGLMNFRNTADIYSLLDKGILIQEKGRIQLFSKSFRAYILQLLPSEQLEALRSKMEGTSSWQSFRKPFLLILIGAAAFIFFTQQEAWQRIIALLTAFTTSLPLLLNVFSSPGASKKT